MPKFLNLPCLKENEFVFGYVSNDVFVRKTTKILKYLFYQQNAKGFHECFFEKIPARTLYFNCFVNAHEKSI